MLVPILNSIVNALYPPRCLFCGEMMLVSKWGNVVCDSCRKNVKPIGKHICIDCNEYLGDGEICPNCFVGDKYFYHGVALFWYEDIREGIINFKFHNMRGQGIHFGNIMASFLKRHNDLMGIIDCIVAVPMHEKKQKMRRYNQAEVLAENIGERLNIPYNFELIIKVKETTSQTRISNITRSDNIKDSFIASRKCRGLTILLIDDVYTTGSTVNECSKALIRAGAERVLVFTLALA